MPTFEWLCPSCGDTKETSSISAVYCVCDDEDAEIPQPTRMTRVYSPFGIGRGSSGEPSRRSE